MKKLNTPLEQIKIESLKSGERVLISGKIYTARDQAHGRLWEAITSRKKLPIDLKNQIIYYCGPTKSAGAKRVGSCGPTTSLRMDEFTPLLLKAGLKGMIGKGARSKQVVAAIKKYKAVYFLTYAGCGALLSKYVKNIEPLFYKDLGPEAIYKLQVEEFPAIVGIDSKGRSVYKNKNA